MTTTAECIVIGGGVMGCSIALRLARAGVKTVVLERAIPGAEASSAAAGILAAQEEAEGPGPLCDLALRSRARFPDLAVELRDLTGIDIGYRATPLLSACLDPAGEDALERRYAWQRAAGLRLHWAHGAELRDLEPALGPRVVSALVFPDDGQLEPRAYLRALAMAAARSGATFTTGVQVRRVVHEGARVVGVDVDGERLAAPRVVVAAGSWSSLVEGAALAPRAVRPMRGQIVQLETRPPLVRGTVVHASGYVVGRADGRVLCGSTMEHVGFARAVTAGGLRAVLELALTLAPGLADAPVTETWSNFRPTTDDHLPILGPTPIEGLFLATGHFRNGILLSPITADIVRDIIVSGTSPIDLAPFSPTRF